MQLAQVHLSRVITEMTCSSWLVCSPAQLKPQFRALPVGVPSCSFLPQWIALISVSRPFPVTSPLPHCSPTLGLKMYEWLSRSFSVRFTRLSITLYCCTFSNVVVLGEQKLFLKERLLRCTLEFSITSALIIFFPIAKLSCIHCLQFPSLRSCAIHHFLITINTTLG